MGVEDGEPGAELPPGEYARWIERYLCRKNDGHLVRIVGPAFEKVCHWATTGIPLKVACRGIDRRFERYYRKGTKRRPLRIEFCEADVLDAFDEWRRAVGIALRPPVVGDADTDEAGGEETGEARPAGSLPAHLDRVALRLTSLLAGQPLPGALQAALDETAGQVDRLRRSARVFRGSTRDAAIATLDRLDETLMDVAVATCDRDLLAAAEHDAIEELRAFRGRLVADDWSAAVRRATRRAVRERLGLPTVVFA